MWRRHFPREYLFVVSPGRSGSTLVQGLLNALPRTLIRGENNFYILPLFRAQFRVRDYQRKFDKDTARVRSAHYGISNFDVPAYTDMVRQWTLRALMGDVDPRTVDTVGFKEVRWNEVVAGEEKAFFDWLEALFPGARYVLNWRDPATAIGSGHFRELTQDAATAVFRRISDVQQFLRETRPERTFDLRYEDITGDDPAAKGAGLRGLAEFVVGDCSEELLAKLTQVTMVGHGPYPFGASRTDDAV